MRLRIWKRGALVVAFAAVAGALLVGCGDSAAADTKIIPAASLAAAEATAYPAASEVKNPAITEAPTAVTVASQEFASAATEPPVFRSPLGAPVGDPEPANIETGAFPRIVTRLRLVDPPEYLRDLRYDNQTGRIFVTTSDDQLIVLDESAFGEIARFGFGGALTLDGERRRLYAAPGDWYRSEDEQPVVHVLDMDTLQEIGTIQGARTIALGNPQDAGGGRLFVGSPISSQEGESSLPGVGVYDLETLEEIARFDQAGTPSYNPVRDELLITAYTVYVVDPVSGEILSDLMPYLKDPSRSEGFRWCNGCEVAKNAHVFEREGLLVIERGKIHTGSGPGSGHEPLYFDAATLEPVEQFDRRLSMQFMCGSRPLLLPPVDNVIYRQPYFIRYVVYRNFAAYSPAGESIAWRDGLFAPYINPRTRQAYVTQGYVLDLKSLSPLGAFPEFCPLDVAEDAGRIYGRIEGDLLVVDETGGVPLAPLPTEPEPLPEADVRDILVSPGYPDDPAIFAVLGNGRVYRSLDDAKTWDRIQGGLPADGSRLLTLEMSPSFETDRTLFAGGFISDYQGEGALRSTDGGDTWQPVWSGLSMLRVYDLDIAPDYATSGMVRAYSYYHSLVTGDQGVGIFESQDRGLSWSLVLTATDQTALNAQPAGVAAAPLASELPVRLADYGHMAEVRTPGGESWTVIDLGQQDNEMLRAVVPSPSYETDNTIYVLGDFGLWRTQDRGSTWSRWDDPRLRNRTYQNALSALAVSPVLPDESHKLFVGSHAGEFWILTPAGVGGSPATTTLPAQQKAAAPTATLQVEQATAPAQTSEAALLDDPPAGVYRPIGPLASLWEASEQAQVDLGYALQETAVSSPAAYQSFQHGSMIWRGDTHTILALFDDGTWRAYSDTYEEGEPEWDPSLIAPGGTQQPLRGFGKLWRSEPEVRERLGWALDKEQGYNAFVQQFERGFLLGSPIGARVFVEDDGHEGRWR